MSDPDPTRLSEKEKAMLYELQSGERLSDNDRRAIEGGCKFIPLHMRPRFTSIRSLIEAGERVEVAALLTEEGEIYSLPRPGRHHNIMEYMRSIGLRTDTIGPDQQGFLSTSGHWLRRTPAMRLALAANQVIKGKTFQPEELFSEDLW